MALMLRSCVFFLSATLMAGAALAAPAAPADPKPVPKGPGRIDVSWTDLSSDETGFRVERSDDGGVNFSTAGTVGADETSFSDVFTPGTWDRTLLSYRVFAFDGGGDSSPTAEVHAVPVFSGEPLFGWLVVTDFGATPDDATDDTVAIQTAFDALSVGLGFGTPDPHVLYFPQGTYRISAPLLGDRFRRDGRLP